MKTTLTLVTGNIRRRLLLAVEVSIVLAVRAALAQYNFVSLNDPLAAQGTFAYGVSGNTVVGYYMDSNSIAHGFTYDIPSATFKTVDAPGSADTYFLGISGTTIVGTDSGGGFTYNGSSFISLSGPGHASATPHGVSGNTVVGTFTDTNGATEGFSYNGSAYNKIIDPLAPNVSFQGTYALGISSSTVVGFYGGSTYHGFIYNGLNFMTLDDPLGTEGTTAWGTSGGLTVGYYTDGSYVNHGFFYNGSSFFTFDDPLAGNGDLLGTEPFGVSGDTVVGIYRDSNNGVHGFLVTVPEPSAIALMALMVVLCLCRRSPASTA